MDNLKAVLDRMEADITEVKRQYDFFLQGIRKVEPIEERRALERTIRRIGQRKIINTSDQFRFNALQGKFYALAGLWARNTRDLEEGRLVRDVAGSLVRTPGARPEPGSVDMEHIEAVVEQMRNARRECGLTADEEDAELIRKTLVERAREISDQAGGKRIEFRVSVENGKPKIKAQIV